MAEKKTKQRGLGRGLSALMADVTEDTTTTSGGSSTVRPDMMVPIETVFPNPEQPRRSFGAEDLQELTASVREKGIIQPLIVRARPGHDGQYEIVAGERRWRAAQQAQLHQLPVILRDYTDTEVLEVAIIENIQRADLNPVEEAMGYVQLMDKFGHTQEKLAEVLGKSRSYIANLTRLLTLPEGVQAHLQDGSLSIGHARALITAENPAHLARQVIDRGLSVRETERLVKSEQNGEKTGTKPAKTAKSEKDADTKALEGDLAANLGMKVLINHKDGQEAGELVIKYSTLDQLDDLCRILTSR